MPGELLVAGEQPAGSHSGEGSFGPGCAWSRRGTHGLWLGPRGCGHLQEEGSELGACPELLRAVQTAAPKPLGGIHTSLELPTDRAQRQMGC